jgi:hypothetical protein
MAFLPVSSRSHSFAGIRGRKAQITVRVPHLVVTLMEYKRRYWLTNARMVRYQSMLCENPQVKLEFVQTLNPATLLP